MTTFIDRLKLAAKVYRDGMPRRYQTKTPPMIWPDFRVGKPEWHMVDLDAYIREGFNMNTLIYSAIMYKAKALSSVPLRAYTGDLAHPDPLPDNAPLAKLCARPNISQSWREFQMLQTVWLNLTGNAFTYFERKGDVVTSMLAFNPLRIYIVPGTRGTIKGYLYVPEGASQQDGIPFLPEDMSHVKLPNPGDPLDGGGYGLSPLSSMAYSADVDNDITKFLKVFFEKGTMVGGILKFQAPMDDVTIARVKERWKEIYGGYENFGEIGVLDQQGEYQRISMTFDEMGFETLDERNESRILGPFGVPPILVGSRLGLARSTYSNYEQAYNAFWNDTMLHEARLFEDDYQYFLGDGKQFVAFDFSDVPAFQQDVPAMVQAWRGLVEYGIPKNMAADTVGLSFGKLPDGDVSYMPLSLVPIEQAQSQRDANTEARTQGAENVEDDERQAGKKGHWITVDRDGENQAIFIDDPGTSDSMLGSARYYARRLGYDPDKVRVSHEKKYFELNGQRYLYGGSYNPDTGNITLYPNEGVVWSDKAIQAVMAHEIEHDYYQKYEKAWDADNIKIQEIASKTGLTSIMDMSGRLKPEYKGKFPAYELAFELEDSKSELLARDGITGYSTESWNAAIARTGSWHRSVDETLAEASYLRIAGKTHKNLDYWLVIQKKVRKAGA